MTTVPHRLLHLLVALALGFTLTACGSDSDDSNGESTATPTTQPTTPVATPTTQATATRTPIAGAVVSGLVVVNQTVSGHTSDRLGLPPAAWMADARNGAFDRALGLADWVVAEVPGIRGTTEADGQFVIGGLAPGRYTLLVTAAKVKVSLRTALA
jgi:hypothetical protein